MLKGDNLERLLKGTYREYTWCKRWSEDKGKFVSVPTASKTDTLFGDSMFKKDVGQALQGREPDRPMAALDSTSGFKMLFSNGLVCDFERAYEDQIRTPTASDRISRKAKWAFVEWEEDMRCNGVFVPGIGRVSVTPEEAEFRAQALDTFCDIYVKYLKTMTGESVRDDYDEAVVDMFMPLVWTEEDWAAQDEIPMPTGPLPLCPCAKYLFYGISEEADLAIYMLMLFSSNVSGMRAGLEEYYIWLGALGSNLKGTLRKLVEECLDTFTGALTRAI